MNTYRGMLLGAAALILTLPLSLSAGEVDVFSNPNWGNWKLLDTLLTGWSQTDTGDVIKVNGQYQMWYGAHNNGSGYTGEWNICYATSTDVVSWTPHGVVLHFSDQVEGPDNTGCGDPTVLCFGGRYHMWYDWKLKEGYDTSGQSPEKQWKIGYATSTDGVNWTVKTDRLSFHPSMENSYYKATHGMEPRIMYVDDNTLWMYYNKKFNGDGTYRSVSHDGGLTWGPQEQTASMTNIHRCWDVFWHGGKYRMLYNHTPGPIYIADSTDGLNWTDKRLFLAGDEWTDSDALYPVNVEANYPTGLSPGNDIEVDSFCLLLKKMTGGSSGNHRMGLVQNIQIPHAGAGYGLERVDRAREAARGGEKQSD